MDQQPDKIFRDKLQGYDSPVPSQAWNRVAANIQPKRRAVWWLSAAAVALIGSAAVFLYPLTKKSTQLAETITQLPRQKQSPTSNESDANAARSAEAITKKETSTPVPSANTNADKQSSRRKSTGPEKGKENSIEREDLPLITLPEPELVAMAEKESVLPSVIEDTNAAETSGRKTITIVLSAKEVNEKYLSKTNPAHATSAAEEASTLKNMLDKAYDLTHNQSPLGELRQKKNEILAMNFRKDKPRPQND